MRRILFAAIGAALFTYTTPDTACAGGCTGTVLTSPAQFNPGTTLVNFDTYPGGGSVPAATADLDTEWVSVGLLISDSSPANGARVYPNTYLINPHTPPNGIADSEGDGMGSGGFILFTFVDPATGLPRAVQEAGVYVANGDQSDTIEFLDCNNATLCDFSAPVVADTFFGLRYTPGISGILVTGVGWYLCDNVQYGGVAVCGGNQPPVITEGATLNMAVAQNSLCTAPANQRTLNATDDGPLGSLSWTISSPPALGSAQVVSGSPGGTVTICYQPANGQTNPTSFVVRVFDGTNEDTITVNVTINATGNCASGLRGDMDLNGVIDGRDVDLFTKVLLNPAGFTTEERCRADIGSSGQPCIPDGTPNINDVPGFVALLVNEACS